VVLIKKELLMSRAGMDIERAADAEARCFAALSFSRISLFEKSGGFAAAQGKPRAALQIKVHIIEVI
jgi:hypothetical protein